MKLIVEGTTEEIKNVFQAISGSEEHEKIKHDIEMLNSEILKIRYGTYEKLMTSGS